MHSIIENLNLAEDVANKREKINSCSYSVQIVAL